MRQQLIFLVMLLFGPICNAQTIDEQVKGLEGKRAELRRQLIEVETQLESLRFKQIASWIAEVGEPSGGLQGQVVRHKAMVLNYVEAHEQSAWVHHVIVPEVATGKTSRTNDFRADPLVKTGTAVEQDYFLKERGPDGKMKYDGFGYDRGHLAPSADFRWSKSALSESYFYSNMSPQFPALNRGVWARLEGRIRDYVIRTGHPLHVVTGGVLEDDLPRMERAKNNLTIPRKYYKVAYDPIDKIGIGFILKNVKEKQGSWTSHATSIDKVEAITGINFFPKMGEAAESSFAIEKWKEKKELSDCEPLPADKLPKKTFNTEQAKYHVKTGKEARICGKVVSTHRSKKGNVFLNLDKSFPNQIFSVSIWKSDVVNFSYKPEVFLKSRLVCVTGKISDYQGVPSMNVARPEQIEVDPELGLK